MTEPVSLEEAKLNARVDSDEQDSLIESWITTARRWVERKTGHLLVPQIVTESFDAFGPLRLRAWPIAPDAVVTLSYIDRSGISLPWTDYRLATANRPAMLLPAIGTSWPVTVQRRGAITATFEAGYASPADVPEDFKTAIQIIVKGFVDERRLTPEIKQAAVDLIRDYRRRGV